MKKLGLGLALTLGGLLSLPLVSLHAQNQSAPALSDKDKRQADEESKEGAAGEEQIGKQLKLVTDPAATDRVNMIGRRLAAVANTTSYPAGFGNDRVYPFTWHFHVVDDKSVNAFSLPGGYIYVNSGLLAAVRSDDELAGVLGHEITHAAHHHMDALQHEASKMSPMMMLAFLAAILSHSDAATKVASFGQYAELGIMNNKYSEDAERDADHGGVILMQKAGYNPVGMLTFMERLGDFEDRGPQVDEGIFRNHPPAVERIASIHAELAQMRVPITIHVVRLVSGGFRATVLANDGRTSQVVFNKEMVATLADPSGARARAVADALNRQLDAGLQLSQVAWSGDTLLTNDRPLLTFTAADAALAPGSTPAALAAHANEVLSKGLYAQSFVVSQASL